MSELAVTHTIFIKATPEQVFQAWLDPHQLQRWFLPEAESLILEIEVVAESGGRFKITTRNAGNSESTAWAQFLELRRPQQFKFDWMIGSDPATSRHSLLTISLFDQGESITKLILEHQQLADAAEVAHYQQYWQTLLGKLGAYFDHLNDV